MVPFAASLRYKQKTPQNACHALYVRGNALVGLCSQTKDGPSIAFGAVTLVLTHLQGARMGCFEALPAPRNYKSMTSV